MKIVIMCGGIGSRLKPLSTLEKPKPFLQYFSYDNRTVSLIERIYLQLLHVYSKDDIFIATNPIGYFNVKKLRLTNNIIVEPESRDTFPCLCNVVQYFVQKDIHDYIAFVPSDSYVEDSFYDDIKQLQEILAKNQKNIGLVGKKCSVFSNKYGYLIADKITNPYFTVSRVIEKPNEVAQKSLHKETTFFNCGVLVSHVDYLKTYINKYLKVEDYEDFKRKYCMLPKISFDYEILEKESNIVGYITNSSFEDLGTWESFLRYTGKRVFNELNISIKTVDLPNLFIAVSSDGVLIDRVDKLKLNKENFQDFNSDCITVYSWGYTKKITERVYLGYFIKNNEVQNIKGKLFVLDGQIEINETLKKENDFLAVSLDPFMILEDAQCLIVE